MAGEEGGEMVARIGEEAVMLDIVLLK